MGDYKRWATLDVLKAISIIAIIIAHLVFWWFVDLEEGTVSLDYNQNIMFIFFNSVIFLMGSVPASAGIALRFYFRKFLDKNRTLKSNLVFKNIILKSVLLFLLGYLLNLFAFGFEDFFAWDILYLLQLF